MTGHDTGNASYRVTIERRELFSWRWSVQRWAEWSAGSKEWSEETQGRAWSKGRALRRARKAIPVRMVIEAY